MALAAWAIPKIWEGGTAFILGGGPSLLSDLSCIHKERVVGVNQAFRLGSWVDVCYFGDCHFYSENLEDLRQFGGLIVSSCQRDGRGWGFVRRVRRSKDKPFGIESKRSDSIAWNNNSGASAVNIAYWLGAKRIVLVGFDMHPEKGRHNWHDLYPKRQRGFNPYPRHMICWPIIAKDAKQLGIEILNATPGSAIQDFPYIELNEAIN